MAASIATAATFSEAPGCGTATAAGHHSERLPPGLALYSDRRARSQTVQRPELRERLLFGEAIPATDLTLTAITTASAVSAEVSSLEDNLGYRAAVLTGRTQALAEVTELVNRLSLNVEPEHEPEVTLGTLVSNWLEVVAWLTQAETEAVDELAVLSVGDAGCG